VRPPVERYVRAVCEHGDIEMIAGIELRDGDDFVDVKDMAKRLLKGAWLSIRGTVDMGRPTKLAALAEEFIVRTWPDRYWFLEVCVCGERDGWIQIFAPGHCRSCCAYTNKKET